MVNFSSFGGVIISTLICLGTLTAICSLLIAGVDVPEYMPPVFTAAAGAAIMAAGKTGTDTSATTTNRTG